MVRLSGLELRANYAVVIEPISGPSKSASAIRHLNPNIIRPRHAVAFCFSRLKKGHRAAPAGPSHLCVFPESEVGVKADLLLSSRSCRASKNRFRRRRRRIGATSKGSARSSASLKPTRNWRVGRYFPRAPFLISTSAGDVCRARKRTIHFNNGSLIMCLNNRSLIMRPKNHDVLTQGIVIKSVCCLVKFRAVS